MADAPAPKTIAQILLEAAKQDLAACKLLGASIDIADAIVGFHAQQAAEKSIKSVLSLHGVEIRRTHDLIALLDLLQDNSLPAPPHADWLDELNPFAVEARYGTIEPDGLDRTHALTVVNAVVAWAQSQTTMER
jgi:HEPN domain-containing protein